MKRWINRALRSARNYSLMDFGFLKLTLISLGILVGNLLVRVFSASYAFPLVRIPCLLSIYFISHLCIASLLITAKSLGNAQLHLASPRDFFIQRKTSLVSCRRHEKHA